MSGRPPRRGGGGHAAAWRPRAEADRGRGLRPSAAAHRRGGGLCRGDTPGPAGRPRCSGAAACASVALGPCWPESRLTAALRSSAGPKPSAHPLPAGGSGAATRTGEPRAGAVRGAGRGTVSAMASCGRPLRTRVRRWRGKRRPVWTCPAPQPELALVTARAGGALSDRLHPRGLAWEMLAAPRGTVGGVSSRGPARLAARADGGPGPCRQETAPPRSPCRPLSRPSAASSAVTVSRRSLQSGQRCVSLRPSLGFSEWLGSWPRETERRGAPSRGAHLPPLPPPFSG